MEIVPTPLEKTPADLVFQINRLAPYYKYFQIDISDGIYAPNKTVQIEEISAFITDDRKLNADRLIFDFHLMVKNYGKEIEKLKGLFKKINIRNIFIHCSLSPDYRKLTKKYPQFQFGLVINSEDSVSEFKQKYPDPGLPLIQIMTVDLGYQGSPFKPEMLQKIEQLRELGYRSKISIDGSVNDQTLPVIMALKNKPDILVIGSFLTKSGESLQQRVDFLRAKAA